MTEAAQIAADLEPSLELGYTGDGGDEWADLVEAATTVQLWATQHGTGCPDRGDVCAAILRAGLAAVPELNSAAAQLYLMSEGD